MRKNAGGAASAAVGTRRPRGVNRRRRRWRPAPRLRRIEKLDCSSSDDSDSSMDGRAGNLKRAGKWPPNEPSDPERVVGAIRR